MVYVFHRMTFGIPLFPSCFLHLVFLYVLSFRLRKKASVVVLALRPPGIGIAFIAHTVLSSTYRFNCRLFPFFSRLFMYWMKIFDVKITTSCFHCDSTDFSLLGPFHKKKGFWIRCVVDGCGFVCEYVWSQVSNGIVCLLYIISIYSFSFAPF